MQAKRKFSRKIEFRRLSLAWIAGGIYGLFLLVGCDQAEETKPEARPGEPTTGQEPEALQILASALALQQQGNYAEALQEYEKALQLDPTLRGVTCQMGIAKFQLGDHDGAMEMLDRSIAMGEEETASRLLLGVIHAKEKRYEEAEAEFEQVLVLEPGEAQAHYNMGEMLREQGRKEEAVIRLRQAVQINPQEPLFAFKLRLARLEAGEAGVVEQEAREQLMLDSPTGDWLMTAAAINLHREEWQEAAKMLGYAGASMQPQMFFAMLQDRSFAAHAERPEIRPFYQVEISADPSEPAEKEVATEEGE